MQRVLFVGQKMPRKNTTPAPGILDELRDAICLKKLDRIKMIVQSNPESLKVRKTLLMTFLLLPPRIPRGNEIQ